MRAALLALLTIAILSAAPLRADYIYYSIDINIAGFSVDSHASATYDCPLCFNGRMTGEHAINDGAAGTVARATFGPTDGYTNVVSYNGTISAGTIYDHCYRARIAASGNYGFDNYYGTGMVCAPPNPHPQPITICDDANRNDGTCSPLVIDLQSGRYELSGTNDPVMFDINADGHTELISWTARDATVSFLALDRNGNDRVDDGGELFGNWTWLQSGSRAANGFEVLKEIDRNQDSLINASDAIWPQLLLWTDSNHDGVSQPEEMHRVALTHLTAIETAYQPVGRRDAAGNRFRFRGFAVVDHARRPIYDVYFKSVP